MSDVHLWLTQDPETTRITAQERAWSDGDFPRGTRGIGWERREANVSGEEWAKVLDCTMEPADVDAAHQRWWSGESGPVG